MDKFFSIFGKIILVLIVLGLVGAGAYYIGKQTTAKPGASVTPTPSVETSPTSAEGTKVASTTPKIEDKKTEKGIIKGMLGYPAEGIPPLEVYAFAWDDKSKHYFVKTAQNQGTFTIEDVDQGSYYIVAYNSANPKLAGAWTKSVTCGLSVDCKDHSFIPVVVKPGQTNDEAQVKDWYAPEGTFPAKPN